MLVAIACLGGRFGLNCSSALFKILKKCSKFSKITRVIHPRNHPNQTRGFWLITPNQQTLCIEKLISFNSGQLQNSGRLQHNSVNNAMLMTVNRVITSWEI